MDPPGTWRRWGQQDPAYDEAVPRRARISRTILGARRGIQARRHQRKDDALLDVEVDGPDRVELHRLAHEFVAHPGERRRIPCQARPHRQQPRERRVDVGMLRGHRSHGSRGLGLEGRGLQARPDRRVLVVGVQRQRDREIAMHRGRGGGHGGAVGRHRDERHGTAHVLADAIVALEQELGRF